MIKFITNTFYGTKDYHYKIVHIEKNYIVVENKKSVPILTDLYQNALCQWFTIEDNNQINVVNANDGFNYLNIN